jgi:hypothetical protein
MSPREKHIPDDAQRTSICLTAEDRAAIRWIEEVRRAKKNNRITNNDILIDALWYFLEKTENRSREQIRAAIPAVQADQASQAKITQMPKRRERR